MEAALDRAAQLLAGARRPFVFGLAASPVATARLAARLAARIDASIDVEGGDLLEAELAAIAATGQVTATFGEMGAAADLVVLWRVDPRPTHPDFLPREFTPGTRRFVVVPRVEVDTPNPRPGEDIVAPVPEGGDLRALQALRGLLNGASPAVPNEQGGRPAAVHQALRAAAEAIASARRVAILWDASLTCRNGTDPAPEAAAIAAGFALLTLDARTRRGTGGSASRIAAKALGPAGNVAGAMAGLLASTGFPRAIGFSGGAPRRDPDRFGAGRMLGGGGADLVLALEPLRPDRLPARPTILVGSRLCEPGPEPEVFLPIVPPALLGEGVWLRADGVPLPRTGKVAPMKGLDSEAGILGRLLDRLQAAA